MEIIKIRDKEYKLNSSPQMNQNLELTKLLGQFGDVITIENGGLNFDIEDIIGKDGMAARICAILLIRPEKDYWDVSDLKTTLDSGDMDFITDEIVFKCWDNFMSYKKKLNKGDSSLFSLLMMKLMKEFLGGK